MGRGVEKGVEAEKERVYRTEREKKRREEAGWEHREREGMGGRGGERQKRVRGRDECQRQQAYS